MMADFNPKQIQKVIKGLKFLKKEYPTVKFMAFYPKDLRIFYDSWHFFVDDFDFYFSEERDVIDKMLQEFLGFKFIFCYLDFGRLNKEKHSKVKIDLNEKNKR